MVIPESVDILIDARDSVVNSTTAAEGLELILPDGSAIIDNEPDPGGNDGDTEPDIELLLGAADREPGNYTVRYFVGFPFNGSFISGTFSLDISCSSLAPTRSPTESPTTPAPTLFEGNASCGDTLTGDYNDKVINFTFVLDQDGDIIIDARASNYSGNWNGQLVGIEITTPDGDTIADGDELDVCGDEHLLLCLDDVEAGVYIIQFFVGNNPPQNYFGTFNISIECFTNSPTSSPTMSPTSTPTTDQPTTGRPTAECDTCPFEVVLSEISSVSVSDCESESESDSDSDSDSDSGDSDSSEALIGSDDESGMRLMANDAGASSEDNESDDGTRDSETESASDNDGDSDDESEGENDGDSDSDSDSDSGEDEPGKCVDGEKIIYRDGLCDSDSKSDSDSDSESGSDSDSDSDSSEGGDPRTDGFLADVCVTYNITEINPDSNCGEINSLFLELCTSDDTDFDPDALGIGDIDNIISDDTLSGNNVESASGSRNDDGDLGITVVLEDSNVDSFTLCFDNVVVTTSFNQTKDDLDVAEGTINITNYLNELEECDGVGLPCLSLVLFLFRSCCVDFQCELISIELVDFRQISSLDVMTSSLDPKHLSPFSRMISCHWPTLLMFTIVTAKME